MFSPYYAAARRKGRADPLNHVSINAILYTPAGKYWAMTERGRAQIERSANALSIGPSAWSHQSGRLVIDIDEWTVPIPRRMRGRIAVDLGPVFSKTYALDEAQRHHWRPMAPCASVEVDFERPGLSWEGKGYVDLNAGSEPIEDGFSRWNWSREDDGETTRIHYDVAPRKGAVRNLAIEHRADGTVRRFHPEPSTPLPRTGWRVARSARPILGEPARVLKTLEDTPFYSRSMLGFGKDAGVRRAIHETVDLDRLVSPVVQWMLPFKMPRWTR